MTLNFAAMTTGLIVSRLSKLDHRSQLTIAIAVGLQNSALAIFVSSTLLGNEKMALVAVIYGSFTFFTTAAFAFGMKKFLRN